MSVLMPDHGYQLLSTFLDGYEPYESAGFTLSDDKWNLANRKTIAAKPSQLVLNFTDIIVWLKPIAKAYLAWLWLAQDMSTSTCQAHLSNIRQLSRFIAECRPDISQLSELDMSVCEGFQKYLSEYLHNSRVYAVLKGISQFARWSRSEYGVPRDFRPERIARRPQKEKRKLAQESAFVIPAPVVDQLMGVVSSRHGLLWKICNESPSLVHLHRVELLYLQVLKIWLCTPLRISQILLLGRHPLRESAGNEAPGVWIQYEETKTHQGWQETYVPGPVSHIVREAIEVARHLTKELADTSGENYIFLTEINRGPETGRISPCSSSAFTTWFNGHSDAEGNVIRAGFIHRHNIIYNGHYFAMNPHQSRHTHATQIYQGGGGFGTVAEQLHHRKSNQRMTGVYVHGESRDLAELQQAMTSGTVFGKTTPLFEDREVYVGELSDIDLAYFRESGMYLQTTPYGFCTRPIKRGPCPEPHPCWRGPNNEPCPTALLLPRGIDAMEQDVAFLKVQSDMWKETNPESPFLRNVESTLEYYESLKTQLQRDVGVSKPIVPPHQPDGAFDNVRSRTAGPRRTSTPRMRRSARPIQRRSYAAPSPAESVINGKSTTRRVKETIDQVRGGDTAVSLRAFCAMVRISRRTLHKRFPDVVQEINKLKNEREWQHKPVIRDDTEIRERILKVWTQVQAKIDEPIPPLTKFADMCDVSRDYFYDHYPEFLPIFRGRQAEVAERLKQIEMFKREEERLEKEIDSRKDRQIQLLLLNIKLEDAWIKVQEDKIPITIEKFSRFAKVPLTTLSSALPHWRQRIKTWNESRGRAAYEERFQRVWDNLARRGRRVSLAGFSQLCGVSRELLYNEFPEWVDRVNKLYRVDVQVLEEQLSNAWEKALRSNTVPTTVYLARECGVHRNIIYRHCPHWIERVDNYRREMKPHVANKSTP